MESRDIWGEIHHLFEGQAEQIQEIDLVNLKAGSMSGCLHFLLERIKDSKFNFLISGTDQHVLLPSPHAVVNHVLQEQVSVSIWGTIRPIPAIAIYVDVSSVISLGYVRGTWNAMAVLAFFDLLYSLNRMAPGSEVRPSPHTFSRAEREQILSVWRDYQHDGA